MAKTPQKLGPVDPSRIFDFARAALKSHSGMHQLQATLMRIGVPWGEPDLMPQIVVSAFTCELYLKTLEALYCGGMITKTHNLHELYIGLPDALRNRLDAEMAAFVQRTPVYRQAVEHAGGSLDRFTLPRMLGECADAFVEYRYLFEAPGRTPPWTIEHIPYMLHDFILKDQPAWKSRLEEQAKATHEHLSRTPPHAPPGTPPTG